MLSLETKLRHTTISRIPLDEWLARRRDLYLTTYNTPKRQPPVLPTGFEPSNLASERAQKHALDRAATRVVKKRITSLLFVLENTNSYKITQGDTIFIMSLPTILVEKEIWLRERQRVWTTQHFLISNFGRVLNVAFFLLGNSPASEFYMPSFRNTLSVPSF